MTEDIFFCAKTGRQIGGNLDGNVIQFPRVSATPRPVPISEHVDIESDAELSRYVEKMTICAARPFGMTADEIVDDAAKAEMEELRAKFPTLYDPI